MSPAVVTTGFPSTYTLYPLTAVSSVAAGHESVTSPFSFFAAVTVAPLANKGDLKS